MSHDATAHSPAATLAGWQPPEGRERDRPSGTHLVETSPARLRLVRGAKILGRDADGNLVELDAASVSILSPVRPRGFAAMSPEQRRIAGSKGGATSHAKGTGHRFTAESGQEAGRKGGLAPHSRRGRGPRAAFAEEA